MTDPLDLERRGWEALASSADASAAFYGEVLADEVLMLLPGGLVIDDREAALEAMSGAPWDGYELSDERTVRLGDAAAVVTYSVRAVRGDQPYAALVSSTYLVEDGGWRLRLHQQTPTAG